jgi:hypothetical protein
MPCSFVCIVHHLAVTFSGCGLVILFCEGGVTGSALCVRARVRAFIRARVRVCVCAHACACACVRMDMLYFGSHYMFGRTDSLKTSLR